MHALLRYIPESDMQKKSANKKYADFYEAHLHSFVLFRQGLLLFLPSFILIVLPITTTTKLDHLFSSFAIGLSFVVFVSIQLPSLMKAHLLVTFSIDGGEPGLGISVKSGTTTKVEAVIRNLGFSTYKNPTIKFYFGGDFEIVPYDDKLYRDLDFKKKFSVQKRHGGVMFNPKDNSLTVPPQEVLVFPMWVKVPDKKEVPKMKIEFSSENTWGMNEIQREINIGK